MIIIALPIGAIFVVCCAMQVNRWTLLGQWSTSPRCAARALIYFLLKTVRLLYVWTRPYTNPKCFSNNAINQIVIFHASVNPAIINREKGCWVMTYWQETRPSYKMWDVCQQTVSQNQEAERQARGSEGVDLSSWWAGVVGCQVWLCWVQVYARDRVDYGYNWRFEIMYYE